MAGFAIVAPGKHSLSHNRASNTNTDVFKDSSVAHFVCQPGLARCLTILGKSGSLARSLTVAARKRRLSRARQQAVLAAQPLRHADKRQVRKRGRLGRPGADLLHRFGARHVGSYSLDHFRQRVFPALLHFPNRNDRKEPGKQHVQKDERGAEPQRDGNLDPSG